MRTIFHTTAALCLCLLATVAQAANDNLENLIQQVAAPDTPAAIQAIDELAKLGADAQAAAPALIKALGSSDAAVRWHAARTLGAIEADPQQAKVALAAALSDQDSTVRAYAAHALGQLKVEDEAIVDQLIAMVLDKELLVRRAALRALRSIDPPQDKTLPVIVKILDEADPAIVMAALHTIAEEGRDALPRLREALKNEKACYWACLVLAELGGDAAPAVAEVKSVLNHADPDVRLQALVTLGEIGPAAAEARPVVVELLTSDPFEGVRYAACYALGKIGLDEPATEALKKTVGSEDAFLDMMAAWALARNNPTDKALVEQAVSKVVAAFKSDNVHLRRAAAKAAVEFDVPFRVVGPMLIDAVRDQDPTVVANAVEALAEMGPKALDEIDDRLKSKEFRPFAIQLIYRMGPEAASAVPALIDALEVIPADDEDILFQREVAFALGAIGPGASAAVPALVDALDSPSEKVQAAAAYALGKIGPGARAAIPALRQKFRSGDPLVQLASILSMLRIQPHERQLGNLAAPMLIKALESDKELVRSEAAAALGRLPRFKSRSLPLLRKLLEDESPYVRDAAKEAIQALEQ